MENSQAVASTVASSAAGAFLGGMLLFIVIAGIAIYVLQIIANWKIFTKAGEAGWKSIIPFYNMYTQFKFTWETSMFWVMMILAVATGILTNFMNESSGALQVIIAILLLVASVALAVMLIMYYYKLAKAFGHGVGFTIGLLILPIIFLFILAFGSSKYVGKQA